MRPDQRVVIGGPLSTLWNAHGELRFEKMREVGRQAVSELLRDGSVMFVVAECGLPLQWVPVEERYQFWKNEAKAHLVEPSDARYRQEDFPGEYFYVGSEWRTTGQVPVVLLEKYH